MEAIGKATTTAQAVSTGIEKAIERGARAGKLRAFVRANKLSESDNGLAGLLRLADKESDAARAALSEKDVDVARALLKACATYYGKGRETEETGAPAPLAAARGSGGL